MAYKRYDTSTTRKRLTVGIAALLILSGALVVSELTNVTHFFHKQTRYVITPTANGASTTQQKGEAKTSGPTSNNSGPVSQPGDNKSGTGGSVSVALVTPTGNFVSNHSPGKNGSPFTETSVCNTAPGATCQITFTKDGVTRQLESRLTDRNGTAYWNDWTPSSIGLTAGSWQIKAIASSGGQAKTAIDSISLEVM